MCEWASNQRGDHCLARQIDTGSAVRSLKFALAANPDEAVVLHQKRGILDRRPAITGDEAGSLEQGYSRS